MVEAKTALERVMSALRSLPHPTGTARTAIELSARQRHSRTGGHQRPFTMVEMMVVMLVILIVISMLLPALKEARAIARTRVCMNNMRQIQIELAVYDEEYRHVPVARVSGGTLGDKPTTYLRKNDKPLGLSIIAEDPDNENDPLLDLMFCAYGDWTKSGKWGTAMWHDTSFLGGASLSWAYRGARNDFTSTKNDVKRLRFYDSPASRAMILDWQQPFALFSFISSGLAHDLRHVNISYVDGHIRLKDVADDGGYLLYPDVSFSPVNDIHKHFDCWADDDGWPDPSWNYALNGRNPDDDFFANDICP